MATLSIAEHLRSGVTRLEDLATATSADADALGRVLRHLVGRGVFKEPAPGRFTLNDPARALPGRSWTSVAVPGHCPETFRTEFGALARGAGLTVTVTRRQPTGRFVVECRPTSQSRADISECPL